MRLYFFPKNFNSKIVLDIQGGIEIYFSCIIYFFSKKFI